MPCGGLCRGGAPSRKGRVHSAAAALKRADLQLVGAFPPGRSLLYNTGVGRNARPPARACLLNRPRPAPTLTHDNQHNGDPAAVTQRGGHMNTLLDWLTRLGLARADWLALGLGLLLGSGIVLRLRASQIWRHRRALGYTTYRADRLRRLLGTLGAAALAGFAALAGMFVLNPDRFASPADTVGETPTPTRPADETRLLIPKLAVDARVVLAPLLRSIGWEITLVHDEIAHLEGTARPGTVGGAAVAARTEQADGSAGPFENLHLLQRGDRVFITRSGQTWTYEVIAKRTLSPGELVESYERGVGARLALIGCSGADKTLTRDGDRLVVEARLLE